ncbi:RNA 2',3'-cyclic phosphodiesterase [Actibacterium lipolyticum]|uniref:RNA 2',3'-cyclic phosphodiesterase n=1 Tax=Actibacterium lipolyticum TaxID=1524263 RepID=A0A238KNV6_9RHOB|nr:RNA 2',3'-cyclic phosphodiesterase [Actibacterium lipolyticum]SMX43842.1 2'-5'-RNA ligase [Actibacterium lipolyticum]
MIRAFVAIALPDDVRAAVTVLQEELPVPQGVVPENLHLTLCFLGDVTGPSLEEAHHAFKAIDATSFTLSLSGVGVFGGAKPRLVYAGVAESLPLRRLQAKVETAARTVGISVERRRFVPHVTLAYLNPEKVDAVRMHDFVAQALSFSSPSFSVDHFGLYESRLGNGPAIYEELAQYPLG